jgi:hypothetical protein
MFPPRIKTDLRDSTVKFLAALLLDGFPFGGACA